MMLGAAFKVFSRGSKASDSSAFAEKIKNIKPEDFNTAPAVTTPAPHEMGKSFAEKIEKIGPEQFEWAKHQDITYDATRKMHFTKIKDGDKEVDLPVVSVAGQPMPLTYSYKWGKGKDYYIPILKEGSEARALSKIPVAKVHNNDFSTIKSVDRSSAGLEDFHKNSNIPTQNARRIGTSRTGGGIFDISAAYLEKYALKSTGKTDAAGLPIYKFYVKSGITTEGSALEIVGKNKKVRRYLVQASKNHFVSETPTENIYTYNLLSPAGTRRPFNDTSQGDYIQVSIPKEVDMTTQRSIIAAPAATAVPTLHTPNDFPDYNFNIKNTKTVEKNDVKDRDNGTHYTINPDGTETEVLSHKGKYYRLSLIADINKKLYYYPESISKDGNLSKNTPVLVKEGKNKLRYSDKSIIKLATINKEVRDNLRNLHAPKLQPTQHTTSNGEVFYKGAKDSFIQLIDKEGKLKKYAVRPTHSTNDGEKTTYNYETIPAKENTSYTLSDGTPIYLHNGGPNSDHPTITFTVKNETPVAAKASSSSKGKGKDPEPKVQPQPITEDAEASTSAALPKRQTASVSPVPSTRSERNPFKRAAEAETKGASKQTTKTFADASTQTPEWIDTNPFRNKTWLKPSEVS